jgi:hypothetical protein
MSHTEGEAHVAEGDLGQAEMQERFDRINAEGKIGSTPDPTPDENYSLLTPPNAPTPETNAELQAKLVANVVGNRLENTGLTTAQTGAGAEAVPQAEGTKTPGDSQTDLGNQGEGGTNTPPDTTQELSGEEEAKVAELVAGGASNDEATAQVLAERGAS